MKSRISVENTTRSNSGPNLTILNKEIFNKLFSGEHPSKNNSIENSDFSQDEQKNGINPAEEIEYTIVSHSKNKNQLTNSTPDFSSNSGKFISTNSSTFTSSNSNKNSSNPAAAPLSKIPQLGSDYSSSVISSKSSSQKRYRSKSNNSHSSNESHKSSKNSTFLHTARISELKSHVVTIINNTPQLLPPPQPPPIPLLPQQTITLPTLLPLSYHSIPHTYNSDDCCVAADSERPPLYPSPTSKLTPILSPNRIMVPKTPLDLERPPLNSSISTTSSSSSLTSISSASAQKDLDLLPNCTVVSNSALDSERPPLYLSRTSKLTPILSPNRIMVPKTPLDLERSPLNSSISTTSSSSSLTSISTT